MNGFTLSHNQLILTKVDDYFNRMLNVKRVFLDYNYVSTNAVSVDNFLSHCDSRI